MSEINDQFLSLKKISEGLYKEKGSKFFAYAFPIKDETEFKDTLQKIKKDHPTARHHCYAFRINPEMPYERANDDGEPNHSAGTPILNTLLSHNLMNVGAVVVRYFGGTKLGVSGLIHAYKESTEDAINQNIIEEKFLYETITICFDYQQMNNVMRLTKEFGLIIENQDHNQGCRYTFGIRKSIKPIVIARINNLKSVTVC